MKTYLISSKHRYSVIEFFDQLVKEGSVTRFFVGDVDPESKLFHLLYTKADHVIDIAMPHYFNPFYASIQLEVQRQSKDEFTLLNKLNSTLSNIDANCTDSQKANAIKLIQEYVDVTMAVVNFEDDGHFKVDAELEWRG